MDGWKDREKSAPSSHSVFPHDVRCVSAGMPPVDMSAWHDLSLRESADTLARKWHLCNVLGTAAPDRPEGAAAEDVKGWSSEQVVAFLDRLSELRSMTPLSVRMERFGEAAGRLRLSLCRLPPSVISKSSRRTS